MRAEEIRARRAELAEAGEKLRHRPARETLASLSRALDVWRDPGSTWRRELLRRLPAATGFHEATAREGLDRGLARWTGRALEALVRDELGGAGVIESDGPQTVTGFPTTATLLAGSIPQPTLLSIVAPLVLRSPVLVKPASRDPVTPELVADSIAEVDPELGAAVAVADFPGSDDASVRAFLEADCVVANGSDETLAAVAARVPPGRRFVGYGHRVSFAAVGEDATRGAALDMAARAAALDVALWDQLGCLSPVALFVVGRDQGAADRMARALARELAEAEGRWPRGAIDPESAALIARERAEAEMRAAAGRRVALFAGPGTSWSVVREDDAAPRPAPLHRFVRVCPVADEDALVRALSPWARHLAAVGLAGTAPGLSRRLAWLGASRVCRLGTLQSPGLSWPRDGRGVLLPLARRAASDAGE